MGFVCLCSANISLVSNVSPGFAKKCISMVLALQPMQAFKKN